jgi:hypothetical protein
MKKSIAIGFMFLALGGLVPTAQAKGDDFGSSSLSDAALVAAVAGAADEVVF